MNTKHVAVETIDIKVRIPADIRRQIEDAAKRDGVSMSLVARQALRAGLQVTYATTSNNEVQHV